MSPAADAVAETRTRPFCAEASRAREEPLGATASRIEHWLLVEYAGYWPYDPLDAAPFAGRVRAHLAAQLEALPYSRLFLVRDPRRADRDGRVRVVYGATPERGRCFYTLELRGHDELLGLDVAAALAGRPVGEPLEHPLVLVCTHGKRDRCCARYGRALCERLSARLPPGWALQSSHVGGDRFAGNAVVLPEGVYYGRLAGRAVDAVLAAALRGRLELDHYRGRSCHPFPVQAAELEVRRRTGLDGVYDLRVEALRREGRRRVVELRAEVSGERFRVELEEEQGPEAFLTCKAAEPRRARRFAVRGVEVSG